MNNANNIQTKEYQNNYMPGYGELIINANQLINTPETDINVSPSNSDEENAYILFLYPNEARQIRELINTKLNTLDYEGSIIFHEYPDKTALLNILDQIDIPYTLEEISPNWLRQLIEVIFINELYNKRQKYFENTSNNNINSNNSTTPNNNI